MLLLRHHPLLLLAVLLLTVALALAEYAWRRGSGRGYDLRAVRTTLGVMLGQMLLRPLNLIATTAILTWFARFAPWHWPIGDWRTWAAGFVAVELAYYWFHRFSHMVAWGWATHSVHHSPTELVLPAAVRLGWTELLSLGWICFVPLALIGLPPAVIGALLGTNLLYQYGLHTEAPIRLGPLEWWFNSPTHHRLHHSRDAEFLDCNYGGVLIVFDRLFGTYRAAPAGTVIHYGLVHPVPSANPLRVALAGWRMLFANLHSTRGWRQRLAVAFGPPA
jgi:sterol desaturase/sphingolipid hydroxylase (fatty acid hydroxylase superfamily)